VNDWWGILWLVVLLAANAFFVGAEFAVLAARRAQIEPKACAPASTSAACRLEARGSKMPPRSSSIIPEKALIRCA